CGNWERRTGPVSGLLPFAFAYEGQHEVDAALLVHPDCGRDVQIVKRNLLRPRPGKTPKRRRDNRVILDFPLVPIAKHEHGCWFFQPPVACRLTAVWPLI